MYNVSMGQIHVLVVIANIVAYLEEIPSTNGTHYALIVAGGGNRCATNVSVKNAVLVAIPALGKSVQNAIEKQ